MTPNDTDAAKPPPWRRQAAILTSRYLDTMLGDAATLLLLIAQGPIIGVLRVLVWSGIEHDTASLHFVLKKYLRV